MELAAYKVRFVYFQPKSGTEYGPEVMRNAGLVKRLSSISCDVVDHGDVELEENEDTFPTSDVGGNVKNPRAVAAIARKVSFSYSVHRH